MIRSFLAWRYRNKVLVVSDAILSSLGPNRSKMFFRTGFWGPGWKAAIRKGYEDGTSPVKTAADIVTACLRNVIARTLTADQRAMTLYAIKTGNESDITANHFMSILEGIRVVAEPIIFKAAMYELIGSLEGREGIDLDNYRDGRLIEDVLRETQQTRHGD